MNRRQKEKQKVKQALSSSNIILPDIHGPEPREVKKVRLAIERQVSQGDRKIIWVGDCVDFGKH